MGVLQGWCQGAAVVWGDCEHPTALQEGKWEAIVIPGECQDRSKSDMDWPNGFA